MAHNPDDHEPAPGAGGDDIVLPFRTDKSGVSGRLVRLGGVVDEILTSRRLRTVTGFVPAAAPA